ncbi:MAG TPA: hypothetical protein VLY83_00595 [Methanoregula sp.]|nr:hypothetical protein [Methanoregula sp.]
MDTAEDQDIDVRKDLHHLTSTLTADDLKPEVMFARKRGIRSCTPPFTSSANGNAVNERLKRVPPPEAEE